MLLLIHLFLGDLTGSKGKTDKINVTAKMIEKSEFNSISRLMKVWNKDPTSYKDQCLPLAIHVST